MNECTNIRFSDEKAYWRCCLLCHLNIDKNRKTTVISHDRKCQRTGLCIIEGVQEKILRYP